MAVSTKKNTYGELVSKIKIHYTYWPETRASRTGGPCLSRNTKARTRPSSFHKGGLIDKSCCCRPGHKAAMAAGGGRNSTASTSWRRVST